MKHKYKFNTKRLAGFLGLSALILSLNMTQTVQAQQSINFDEVVQNVVIVEEDVDSKQQVLDTVTKYHEQKDEEFTEQIEEQVDSNQLDEDAIKQLNNEWVETLLTLSEEDTEFLLDKGVQFKGDLEGILPHINSLNEVQYVKTESPVYFYRLKKEALLDDELFELIKNVMGTDASIIILGEPSDEGELKELFNDQKWYSFIEFNDDITVEGFSQVLIKGVQNHIEAYSNPIITANLPANNITYNGVTFATYPTIPSQSTFNYGFDDPAYTALIGRAHSGVDISYTTSVRDIYSVDQGVVTKVNTGCSIGSRDCGGGYGNYIEVSHPHLPGNMKTLYAHLSGTSVTVGQAVQAGQLIGQMGTTGRSDGVHLHFEVFTNNTKVNPTYYINFSNYG